MTLHPIVTGLARIQRELTAIAARAGELQRQAALLDPPMPARFTCTTCDGLAFRSAEGLAEHNYHQHDGPEPPHWLDAETKAAP